MEGCKSQGNPSDTFHCCRPPSQSLAEPKGHKEGHCIMRQLTAGEECQQAAKTCSSFVGQTGQGSIPSLLVRECLGLALLKGPSGEAVIRLPSGGIFHVATEGE